MGSFTHRSQNAHVLAISDMDIPDADTPPLVYSFSFSCLYLKNLAKSRLHLTPSHVSHTQKIITWLLTIPFALTQFDPIQAPPFFNYWSFPMQTFSSFSLLWPDRAGVEKGICKNQCYKFVIVCKPFPFAYKVLFLSVVRHFGKEMGCYGICVPVPGYGLEANTSGLLRSLTTYRIFHEAYLERLLLRGNFSFSLPPPPK